MGQTNMNFFKPAICTFCVVAMMLTTSVSGQSSTRSTSSELTRARETAKSAIKKYNTLKRLSERGSASSKEVREADLIRKLSLLDFSTLQNPEKSQENALLRAQFLLKYRTEELKITTTLYRRGSASKLAFNRAVSAKEVAEARVKAILSINNTQRKMQSIKAATSKLEVAEKEFDTGTRLFQSGSISRSVLDQLKSNLEIAKSELAEAKKSLGAKATVQKQ